MPTSRPNSLTHVCNMILKTNPKTVLDIGIGHGKWGFLAREYTDIWNQDYFDHKVAVHGIEIYKKYITSLQEKIYDKIVYGNIVEILPKLAFYYLCTRYDMVIWGDCIEHLSKEDGFKMLRILKEKQGVCAVTTPKKFYPQKKTLGNKYEEHVSCWTVEELQEFGLVYDLNKTLVLEINS